MNEQLRNFLVWLGDQTEGIDQTKLALKLQQIEDEHKAKEFHCLRGVMADWQLQKPEIKDGFCSARAL